MPVLRAAVLTLVFAAASAAHAGVTLSVDRASAAVKEQFYLVLRAEGGRIGEPVMPHLDGLVIQRRPVSTRQQTSVNFINGRVQQNNVREWQYVAWATAPGKMEIPPAKVNIDGNDELSKPVTIDIEDAPAGGLSRPPGGGRPVQNLPLQNAQPQEPAQQPGRRPRGDVTLDEVLLIESSVSKTSIYQGEALAYSVSYSVLNDPSVRVAGDEGNRLNLPSVEGFYEAEIKKDEKQETRNEMAYITTVLSRPMFATKPGTFEIPPVVWSGRITAPTSLGPRSFRAERATEAYTIEVKPLPDSPPNFSGAVGKLNISASLEGGAVEQGKPKIFTVVIAGEGNIDAIPKPQLPAMDWCHVSEPEITVTPLAGPLEFEKRFAYTLTPMRPEMHQIPQVEFVYFAPDIESYKTVSTKPLDVFVQAGEDAGKLVVVGGQSAPKADAVELLASDLAPLLPLDDAPEPVGPHWPLNTLAFGGPPLGFLAGLVYLRRQRRFATDLGYARGMRAKARSRKRLSEAAHSKDPGEALFKALTGFLGDKFNLPDAGMTSQDVRTAMLEYGISAEVVEEYVKVLRTCERQRYSGAVLSGAEAVALTEAAVAALEHFETEVAGKGR
jgi:hypothetical protein